MPQTAATSVDVDSIWRQFMHDFATGDRYWWWPRSIRVDPLEVIADDDEGHLWQVPVSTDGEASVEFGEPVQVRENFVPVATAAGPDERIVAVFTSAPVRPAQTTAASRPNTPPQEEESPMESTPERDALMETLRSQGRDVADDVTTEQLISIAQEQLVATAAPAEENETETETEREPAPVATAGIVQVDEQSWREVQSEVAASRAERERRQIEERDRVIATAMSEGRFGAARREHYENAWAADPEGTRVLLTAAPADGGLAPGLVPTELRGDATDDVATHTLPDGPLPDNVSLLTPAERAQRAS